MDLFSRNDFIFSRHLRLVRHLLFWTVHIIIFSFLFHATIDPLSKQFVVSTLWVSIFLLYCYPIMYWMIPAFLLKEKFIHFCLILFAWAVAGYFANYLFRKYVFFPFSDLIHFAGLVPRNPWAPASYLTMNVMAGFASMIVLFKFWVLQQQAWVAAEKAKATAELELLKAQVHPHFLFNTLNNIYSFALEQSPKTPQLILKLSSLLSYVLYDCKEEYVLLEQEIETMKNYIDLEKERYGNRLEVSLNFEGGIKEKRMAPLLLLPFLENAFKHGTAEQLDKPWLSMDISVKENEMKCKIINSKNHHLTNQNGIGIKNVQKRLNLLYPGKHELKMNNEKDFFVVSISLHLSDGLNPQKVGTAIHPFLIPENIQT